MVLLVFLCPWRVVALMLPIHFLAVFDVCSNALLCLLMLQWGIYDAFKVAAGLPTTGAKVPSPPAKWTA